MRKFLGYTLSFFGILFLLGLAFSAAGIFAVFSPPESRLHQSSVLLLELDGVIDGSEKFLEKLRRYRKEDQIKGILVQVNSPGGVVGPSQEIFMELKRTREVFKKPVVVSCLGLAASGAYYAALGADKFVVTPGCMVGSIGVIMQFANVERLLQWAKIERYVIKTGKFKDIGAEYRPMAPEERELLQGLVNDVLGQFKTDIVASRKLSVEVVNANADGRVFTGKQAVELGFADELGTLDDARRILGEMTGLGGDPEVFKPRTMRGSEWLSFLEEESRVERWFTKMENLLHLNIQGQPLLIWPGALGF